MIIREIIQTDLANLLKLYLQMHDNRMPQFTEKLYGLWESVINDKNHHIIIAEERGQIFSSWALIQTVFSNIWGE